MTRQTTSSDDAKEDGFGASIFGTNHQVPKWVPVTLLAFSSVALVVPIVMLRWPRTINLASSPIRSRPAPQTVPKEVPVHSSPLKMPPSNEDNGGQFFNAPLYTLKALGIATALVTLGATASIWRVMKALNARDTNEVAERLRHVVLTKLPCPLSSNKMFS
ncbi:hypothetical protein BDR04DRAFT_1192655 [Suillus decipiens]|nr:hypothetical protein BDR04DRAFT_1192655 [Suillus decipiens]